MARTRYRLKEDALWNHMRKNFCKLSMERIESWVSNGTPDVHFVCELGAGWLELKSVETVNTKVEIRPSQKKWIRDYAKRKGIVFVLVHAKKENMAFILTPQEACKLGKIKLDLKKGIFISNVNKEWKVLENAIILNAFPKYKSNQIKKKAFCPKPILKFHL